ncbi:MAG: hypothetical protein OWR62_10995 [Sulfobacillus thermotolerans]|nr:hypothetical protein [Sulfobacillus thermotolerans]
MKQWWQTIKVAVRKRIGAKEGNVFIENGIWIIIVVLAMILPIEALRNALIGAFNQITSNLNTIP